MKNQTNNLIPSPPILALQGHQLNLVVGIFRLLLVAISPYIISQSISIDIQGWGNAFIQDIEIFVKNDKPNRNG